MKNSIKQEYMSFMDMIKMQFGDTCHVVIYDFTNPKGEIIGMHGYLTDEEIGDPAPDYILKMIQSSGKHVENKYGFINKNMDGHVLRTSLYFIKDKSEIAGCFCVNHNIVHIKMILSFLEELGQSSNVEEDTENVSLGGKEASGTIQDFVEETVEKFLLERIGFRSFPSLEKKEKVALIRELDDKGIFLVKGSVSMVAKLIGISKFSIYNYLEEIRTSQKA